jgi:hypothetical protein
MDTSKDREISLPILSVRSFFFSAITGAKARASSHAGTKTVL